MNHRSTSWMIVLIMSTFFFQCHRKMDTEKNLSMENPTDSNGSLEKLAKEYFGEDYEVVWNEAQSAAIVRKIAMVNPKRESRTLHFFVYLKSEDSIIFKDSVSEGKINWIDNEVFEVLTIPGIVTGEKNNTRSGYHYHIGLRKKEHLK